KVIRKIFLFGLASIFVVPILVENLELNLIFQRFNENPDFLMNFINDPVKGTGTTREEVYSLGLHRIAERDWILGNGWSVPKGNYFSWFGSYEKLKYADFHSLYLSAIPIFGFAGTIVLILIFLMTIGKLVLNLKKYKSMNSF